MDECGLLIMYLVVYLVKNINDLEVVYGICLHLMCDLIELFVVVIQI